MRSLQIHALPSHVPAARLVGATAVVIDVLRATTVMVEALHAGADGVIPCATIEEAKQRAATLGPDTLLAGERGGVSIEGFELGNSPRACTPARVANRTLVMTTTNGTLALLHAAPAAQVWIAAFTNLPAVVEGLVGDDRDVHLICAGTNGAPTEEDLLLAGGIAVSLTAAAPISLQTPDTTVWMQRWMEVQAAGEAALAQELRASRGGQNLIRLGYDLDIAHAAQVGRHAGVPVVIPGDPATCRLP
ncbi:MAG: 2-phosphosulfolactate phosphatase [Planctomycetota bacterium]